MGRKKFTGNEYFLTVPEAAEILGVGICRAYEMAKAKVYPSYVLGKRRVRIPRQRFFEWLEKGSLSNE